MTKHFIKALTAATFAVVLVSGCAAQAPAVQAVSSSNVPVFEVTSTPASEQLEIKAAAAVKAAETKAAKVAAEAAAVKIAEIKAAADSAAAAAEEQIKAKAAVPPAAAVAPPKATAPAQDFHSWVNATLAKYGVSPGPGASFRVGSTGFCGGYMCTTVERYGTTPFRSVTTVSPGAIGNEFALIHEVAHQKGVGLRDTGGECAADVWARHYVGGSIYC